MEVYAVGNDAAIVIAPLDRDGCLARRSKQATSGRSRAVFVLRRPRAQDRRGSGNPLPLLGEGWRVITTSRTDNAGHRQMGLRHLRHLAGGRSASQRELAQPQPWLTAPRRGAVGSWAVERRYDDCEDRAASLAFEQQRPWMLARLLAL